jgi:hypothetical protein
METDFLSFSNIGEILAKNWQKSAKTQIRTAKRLGLPRTQGAGVYSY